LSRSCITEVSSEDVLQVGVVRPQRRVLRRGDARFPRTRKNHEPALLGHRRLELLEHRLGKPEILQGQQALRTVDPQPHALALRRSGRDHLHAVRLARAAQQARPHLPRLRAAALLHAETRRLLHEAEQLFSVFRGQQPLLLGCHAVDLVDHPRRLRTDDQVGIGASLPEHVEQEVLGHVKALALFGLGRLADRLALAVHQADPHPPVLPLGLAAALTGEHFLEVRGGEHACAGPDAAVAMHDVRQQRAAAENDPEGEAKEKCGARPRNEQQNGYATPTAAKNQQIPPFAARLVDPLDVPVRPLRAQCPQDEQHQHGQDLRQARVEGGSQQCRGKGRMHRSHGHVRSGRFGARSPPSANSCGRLTASSPRCHCRRY